MRGMSARLCDVQLDAFAWQYCPGKYNYNGGRNKGSSSLMMTKSKHQAPIRYYKLTSRNNMYGEATCHISYLVECRHFPIANDSYEDFVLAEPGQTFEVLVFL